MAVSSMWVLAIMVDYLLALYGNEGQLKRKKEVIRTLRKEYPDMEHNPVIAKLEVCVVRVSDYDRYFFEDYANKNLDGKPANWMKSKGGLLGWLSSIPIYILSRCFGFKGYPKQDRFPNKKYGLQPASQVVSFMLGRHEDDYFNLIPHKVKPKGMFKHPNRFVWTWARAKGIAWLYGLIPPEDNPTPEEMKKLNEAQKKKLGRDAKRRICRV